LLVQDGDERRIRTREKFDARPVIQEVDVGRGSHLLFSKLNHLRFENGKENEAVKTLVRKVHYKMFEAVLLSVILKSEEIEDADKIGEAVVTKLGINTLDDKSKKKRIKGFR